VNSRHRMRVRTVTIAGLGRLTMRGLSLEAFGRAVTEHPGEHPLTGRDEDVDHPAVMRLIAQQVSPSLTVAKVESLSSDERLILLRGLIDAHPETRRALRNPTRSAVA
jgi:hypothetical protein